MKRYDVYHERKFCQNFLSQQVSGEDIILYKGRPFDVDMDMRNPKVILTSYYLCKRPDGEAFLEEGKVTLPRNKPIMGVIGLADPKLAISYKLFCFRRMEDIILTMVREIGAIHMHSLKRIIDKKMDHQFMAIVPSGALLTDMIRRLEQGGKLTESLTKKLSHARYSLMKISRQEFSRDISWVSITKALSDYHEFMPVPIPYENGIVIAKELELDLFAIANEGLHKVMEYRKRNMKLILPDTDKYDPTHYFISRYYIRMLNRIIKDISIDAIDKIYKLP